MIKRKLLIGVFTAPVNIERKKAVWESWASKLPEEVTFYFVYGGDSFKKEGHDLYLPCEESYEKLPLKTFHFFNYCSSSEDYDFVLKCDDDSFVNVNQLLRYNFKGDYGGLFLPAHHPSYTYHYGKCKDGSYEKPFNYEFHHQFACGGGYYLSQYAIEKLVANVDMSDLEASLESSLGLEDRLVGLYLKDEGLIIDNNGEWLSTEHSFYSVLDDSIYHPVVPETMLKINSFAACKYKILKDL